MIRKRWFSSLLAISVMGVFGARMASAAGGVAVSKVDTGDTAWMLMSSALVLMMTIPGLALFYGGLVRPKNVLSTLMHSFFCVGLIGVVWVLFGYSLAFGPDKGGLIGGLDFVGLKGILGTQNAAAPTIPALLFVTYQATFAIITPALISGTFAERMRFPAFALFVLLWSVLIYAPVAHWVWGGGWIATKIGALDFAGGIVVHISSGISALVTAIYLGKRHGYPHEPMPPHNLPFTVIGASLLWFGWFGFNGGSAYGSNELACTAFLNTNTAGAAATLVWLLVEWLRTGKPTMLGAASGGVAGLATITPAAGFVTPMAALFIGVCAGLICYTAVSLKPKFGYDDALDVVGVHMVGGTIGALLTGVFATVAVNSAIPSLTVTNLTGGLFYGHAALLWKQLIAVVATYLFCGVGTLVILRVVDAVTRLRADQDEELVGMDMSQHSERAYAFGGGETVVVAASAEPKAASIPPVLGGRFTVTIDGMDADSMIDHWRSLCQDNGTPITPEFRSIYSRVTTIRGTQFRFRGGDREQVRRNLERIFKAVSPRATARIEDEVVVGERDARSRRLVESAR
jgi:ammonium transporter, Amt family